MSLYKLATAIILAVILFPNDFVNANESDQYYKVWIESDSQIVCMSFDLSSLTEDEFIVYDYSPEIGIEMGKPWTIVEEGKCYRHDDSGFVNAFAFKNSAKSVMEESIKKYSPRDNLLVSFDGTPETSHYIEQYESSFFKKYGQDLIKMEDLFKDANINPEYTLWSFYYHDENYQNSPGTTYARKVLFGPKLLPTKIYLRDGVSNGDWTDVSKILHEDPIISEARNLWSTLISDLNEVLEKCDTRIRVEYNFGSDSRKTYWRLANGEDIYIGDDYKDFLTPVQQIVVMGCGDEYQQWLKDNEGEFKYSDVTASRILERLSSGQAVSVWSESIDKLVNNGYNREYIVSSLNERLAEDRLWEILYQRDQKQLDELLDFANSESVSEVYSNIEFTTSSATVLEESNLERNNESFVKPYVILAIIGMFGIFALVYLRYKRI